MVRALRPQASAWCRVTESAVSNGKRPRGRVESARARRSQAATAPPPPKCRREVSFLRDRCVKSAPPALILASGSRATENASCASQPPSPPRGLVAIHWSGHPSCKSGLARPRSRSSRRPAHAQDYSTVTFGAKPGARPNSARPGGTSQRSGGAPNSMTTGSGIAAAKLDAESEELKRASAPTRYPPAHPPFRHAQRVRAEQTQPETSGAALLSGPPSPEPTAANHDRSPQRSTCPSRPNRLH